MRIFLAAILSLGWFGHSTAQDGDADHAMPRGGAPAYVGIDLGLAFPSTTGRYTLFGLEGQEGRFDLFRVGELAGSTSVDYESLFGDALFAGSQSVSGTNGSARATFPEPMLGGADFGQGVVDLLSATEPAMLIEPLSVDYLFLSRTYVAAIGGLSDLLATRGEDGGASLPVCSVSAVFLCFFLDLCVDIGSPDLAMAPGSSVSERFHEEVVLGSFAGRYYASRYRQFASEMIEGIFASPTFIYDIHDAQTRWRPAFLSALDGDGGHFIDQPLEDAIARVVDGYLESASPALRNMIEIESARMGLDNLAGFTVSEVIERIEGSYTDDLFVGDFEALL